LEKSCKDLQTTESKKVRNEGIRGKNGSNTNNFGKTGQHVEMIGIHSTHGG